MGRRAFRFCVSKITKFLSVQTNNKNNNNNSQQQHLQPSMLSPSFLCSCNNQCLHFLLSQLTYGDLNPASAGSIVRREDKARGEDLGAGCTGIGLVAEGNGPVFVLGNISSNHRREEEAVVVGSIERGDLTVDLGLGTQGEDGGRSSENGSGTHYCEYVNVCVMRLRCVERSFVS